MKKVVGYARAIKDDQELQKQVEALVDAGCKKAYQFVDITPSDAKLFPEMERCISSLREGDSLIVVSLDRLGHSISRVVNLINDICARGAHFKSLSEGCVDTSGKQGEQTREFISVLVNAERTLLSELRINEKTRRARGRRGGRKKLKADNPKVVKARELSTDTSLSINDICKILGVSRATYYRYLAIPY